MPQRTPSKVRTRIIELDLAKAKEPVDYTKLKDLLPETVAGLKLTVPSWIFISSNAP